MAFRKFQPRETFQDNQEPAEFDPALLRFPKKGRPGQKSSKPPQKGGRPAKRGRASNLQHKSNKKVGPSDKYSPYASSPRELFKKRKS